MRRSPGLAVVAGSLLLSAATVHAGGIARPNIGGANALGWGGAFTAVADDPFALHANPAGMALQYKDTVMIGGEMIIAPRTYTPIIEDENGMNPVRGEDQSSVNGPAVLPMLGYVTRLSSGGVPSRLALGIGFWNTYGGQVRYDKGPPGVPALDYTQTAALELVPGLAYEVNDFIQIGAAFRLGIGLFAVEATAKPADGEFSAFGIGAGVTLGVMVSPSKKLRIGASWRSALDINLNGSGTLEVAGPLDVNVSHTQEWPQSASLGVLVMPTPRLALSFQADWVDWSHVNQIVIEFENNPGLTQVYRVDFQDNYALHAGAQFRATDALALRGGVTFDSNAVPDRTIERQYLDQDKLGFAVGGSYRVAPRWRIDTAVEIFAGAPPRVVEDNTKEYRDGGFLGRANISPGEHSGQVYSFELNLNFQY